MNKIIILVVVSFLIGGLKAQTNLPERQAGLDSLYTIWQDETQPDSNRVMAYKTYIWNGFLFSDPDSAMALSEGLLSFSKTHNYPKAGALGSHLQGNSNYIKGNYPRALEYYEQSLKIHEEIGDKNGIASSLNGIGVIYNSQGNYPHAMEYYDMSLKLREEVGDKKGIAASLNNIGNIYGSQGNYPRALEYLKKSLKIKEEIGDKNGISATLNNIGNIYHSQGNYIRALEYHEKSLKIKEEIGDKKGIANSLGNIGNVYQLPGNYPRALEYHEKSLKIYEEIGDKSGIARSLNNIGLIYHEQVNYLPALEYYEKSLKIHEEIGDKNGIAGSLNNIGTIYHLQGNYPLAIDFCKRGLDLAEEIEVLKLQEDAYQSLYDTYKTMGKGNEALVYLEKLHVIGDSLNKEETAKKLEQMKFGKQMFADSVVYAKKEALSRMELEKSENTKNALTGGAGLLVLLVGFIFYGYRQKRKANRFLEERNKFEIENKKKALTLFSQHVSPEVAKELLSDSFKSGSNKVRACIMFLDIRNFTPFAEKREPTEIIQYQNDVFGFMIDIISKHNGIINQFMGDGFLAMFGAPVSSGNDSQNAVEASLEILKELDALCASGKLIETKIGIGLHTGDIVTGNVGTAERMQYSITGNTVILASRIEQLNKRFKSELLISKDVLNDLDMIDNLKLESLGPIELKGRSEPLEITKLA